MLNCLSFKYYTIMEFTYIAIICFVAFIIFYLWSSSKVALTPSKTPAQPSKKKMFKHKKRDNDALTRRIIKRFNDDT